MNKDSDLRKTVHHSMLLVLDRMKLVDDNTRYHLMMEWMEVIVDDTEDILTIPKHFKIKEK